MTEEFSPAAFNRAIIEEFRSNGGRVGGPFEGARLLLMTSVGATTGRRRTVPLGYLEDGDRVLVFGSNAGLPDDPAWVRNVLADSRVTVEIGRGEDGVESYEATAMAVRGAERDRLYALQGELVPAYAEYQRTTSRVIPVVALHRADSARSLAIGDEVVKVHAMLRRDLASLREEVTAYLDGRDAGVRTAGPDPAERLRAHCLTFCGSLGKHHDGEELTGFPRLERRHPGLAPVLERLRREHVAVNRLTGDLQELLDGIGSADPGRVRAELDRVTGELEAHYAYEEEEIVPALNTMTAADWAGPVAGGAASGD